MSGSASNRIQSTEASLSVEWFFQMEIAYMNRAVVTISCGSFYERVAQLTHPIIDAYAKKLNADFIVWRDHQGHALPHYKKLDLGQLLETYDRVLYIDTDVLIRDDAPDIFAITPDEQLGLFDEGKYFRDRTIQAIRVMDMFGYDPLLWDGKYYNTGVMVLSHPSQHLCSTPDRSGQL